MKKISLLIVAFIGSNLNSGKETSGLYFTIIFHQISFTFPQLWLVPSQKEESSSSLLRSSRRIRDIFLWLVPSIDSHTFGAWL